MTRDARAPPCAHRPPSAVLCLQSATRCQGWRNLGSGNGGSSGRSVPAPERSSGKRLFASVLTASAAPSTVIAGDAVIGPAGAAFRHRIVAGVVGRVTGGREWGPGRWWRSRADGGRPSVPGRRSRAWKAVFPVGFGWRKDRITRARRSSRLLTSVFGIASARAENEGSAPPCRPTAAARGWRQNARSIVLVRALDLLP